MENTPNILNYKDFRLFLKDVYELRKKEHKKYSYRKYSEDLGFKPSNHIFLVVTGKRNFSAEAINKVSLHFGWNLQQKRYFHNLVLCNQAKDNKMRVHYLEELKKLIGKDKGILSPDYYSYFSKWYIPVIREIVSLKNFVSNLNWISKKLRPRVSEEKVREAIRILERLKMIRKQKNCWVQNQEHLTTPPEVTSSLVHNFQKELLKLSLDSMDQPMDQRKINSMIISLSPKQLEWLNQHITTVLNDIHQELTDSDDDPSMVVQLNVQLVPLTEE